MAKNIKLTSGSIFNGNPITFTVEPLVVTGTDSDGNTVYPSFHRIIFEVTCGMDDNSSGSYETIKMSSPVEQEKSGTVVQIDISSALRIFRDSYEYTPNAVTYPFVSFNVKAYDEYMLNGEVKTDIGAVYYPSSSTYLRTLFGGFSDFERLISGVTRDASDLSRKPTATPQIVTQGDTFAYTPSYSSSQSISSSSSLVPPTSVITTISQEGEQTIGGQSIYALPSTEANKRTTFRFINGFGVLESISIPKAYSKKLSVTSTSYAVAKQETFNSFSRASVKKQNDQESWLFVTDPLTEEWLQWYLHEFLMSEHIWMEVKDTWVPCTIIPDEDITFLDKTQYSMYSVSFTVQLDINGVLPL